MKKLNTRIIICLTLLLSTAVVGRCDMAEAVKLYREAAEQGDVDAQMKLGSLYFEGEGVAKDQSEAVKWFRKAAEQGLAAAQYNLGVCYYNGFGVTKDQSEAVKWVRKAAEQGHAAAQYNLGVSYANGDGVTKDQSEAVKWFRKAAEQGHAAAQEALVKVGDYSNTTLKKNDFLLKKGEPAKKVRLDDGGEIWEYTKPPRRSLYDGTYSQCVCVERIRFNASGDVVDSHKTECQYHGSN
jgi:FOG: TPR repeat, SEL1 subfamily